MKPASDCPISLFRPELVLGLLLVLLFASAAPGARHGAEGERADAGP